MEFCDMCDNMLYFKDNGRVLQKYCKHCAFTKETDAAKIGAIKVTTTLYSEDDLLYMQYKNKYLRFDPTLPRVRDTKVVCPSESCPADKTSPQEVLYVKYHPVHMKYFFQCDTCGTMWRKE